MKVLDIVSGLLPLFLIIIFLGGVLYLVKKYSYKFKLKNAPAVKIETIATKMIMPKKYITVVNVQDKTFVLGICENSITLLKEISDTFSSLKTSLPPQTDEGSFTEILKKNIGLK
jgi:flagellar biosynthetic protein FliO